MGRISNRMINIIDKGLSFGLVKNNKDLRKAIAPFKPHTSLGAIITSGHIYFKFTKSFTNRIYKGLRVIDELNTW